MSRCIPKTNDSVKEGLYVADIEDALLSVREGDAGLHRQAAHERALAEHGRELDHPQRDASVESTLTNPSDRLRNIWQKFIAASLRKN